jgi:hypothetical protein
MPFEYTDATLDSLDLSLSKERLNRYLAMGHGDRKKAIQFYEMNNVVSESLFGVIRGLEVCVRNSYHQVFMKACHNREDWYNHFFTQFQSWEQDSINKVRKGLHDRKVKETPPRMVALLGFGFWCGLTSKSYDACFWVPFLYKAYPNKKLGRRDVSDRLEKIRLLRNRIAHHQSILDHDLSQEHKDILETIGWICPHTMKWVEHNSTLLEKAKELANMIAAAKPPIQPPAPVVPSQP